MQNGNTLKTSLMLFLVLSHCSLTQAVSWTAMVWPVVLVARGGGGIRMEISRSASGSVTAPNGRFHPVAHGVLRAEYCWVEAQAHAAGVLEPAPGESAAVLVEVPT